MAEILKDKKIPTIAITSLVLGGACRKDGGDGGRTPASLARDYCEVLSRCTPDEFEEDYGSIATCTTGFQAELAEETTELREEYGAACADALLDYYECFINDARDCSYSYDACDSAWDNYYEVCGIEPYYYYYGD